MRGKSFHIPTPLIAIPCIITMGIIAWMIMGSTNDETSQSSSSSALYDEQNLHQHPSKISENHYVTFTKEIKPLLEIYCYDCHGDGMSKGSLDMDEYISLESMINDRSRWEKIKTHLKLKLMPPVDELQPKGLEIIRITEWIDNAIFPVDPNNPDPGKVALRRLNRIEYKNTIHDLLGVEVDVENILPIDDTGYGFDTIADVHTVSPAHIEKYLTAAEVALEKATQIEPMPWRKFPVNLKSLRNVRGKGIYKGARWSFFSEATSEFTPEIPSSGIYRIQVIASSSGGADGEEAKMRLEHNGKHAHIFEIPHKDNNLIRCTLQRTLSKGDKLSLSFTNDFYNRSHPNPKLRDRNLHIHSVKLIGPLDQPRPEKPATHYALLPHKLVSQTDETYALDVWQSFAQKAFRRPVSREEILPYQHFLKNTPQNEQELQRAILLGIQAMLVSSEFLYIKSTPESPTSPVSPITESALASRLSYFLWSTTPDEELIQLAHQGKLRSNLSAQVDRMLNDSKAEQFIENFSGQWLQLRDLDVVSPDPKIYPTWSNQLKEDAITETHLFLTHLLKENLNVTDCLDSDYTFLNQRLAKHYGIPNITGNHFRKVTLSDRRRGGLLTQASILTLTSNPDRTSLVLRGKWVLENILGTPPPPPPPDIPDLQPDEKENKHLSLREQLELHRSKPACAACHNLLDPIGFALENYDGVGKWRTHENGQLIDSKGKLITGEIFNNSEELKNVLASTKEELFVRCLTEKLLTYSIGRGVEYYDKPAIDKIVKQSKQKGLTLRSIIHAIVESTPFQKTRTEAP